MASTVRAHARCRAGLAAAGAAALIALTAVTAGPAAAAMRLPAGQAARAGLAAVATAAWPGASRQALAGPRSQLPVFVLDKGRFRAFDIPFGEFGGDSVTINDRGQIAGSYYDDPAATCLRDFLRDRNGRFTRIDFPAPGTTQLLDINDRGQIAGSYRPSAGGACSDTVPLRGFLRDERGRFTTIQIPGARQVQALGINARGQIVGDYLAADGTTHGYLRDHGRIITVDGLAGAAGATVFDINDHAQMVGLYYGSAGEFHAFSLRGGRYTSIDAPGVTYTLPFGVNNRGQIAGLTAAALPLTAASDAHGFVLRDGAGGPLTSVDVPGGLRDGGLRHQQRRRRRRRRRQPRRRGGSAVRQHDAGHAPEPAATGRAGRITLTLSASATTAGQGGSRQVGRSGWSRVWVWLGWLRLAPPGRRFGSSDRGWPGARCRPGWIGSM
jgi:hypothetical protein